MCVPTCRHRLLAGLSFLFYRFREKSLSATASAAKHGAKIIFIISREVVPVRVPEPVPAVQVRRAGVRAVPEIPALRRESLILGDTPLSLREIHPGRPFNRTRGRARTRTRARSRSSGTKSRRSCRSRDSRPADILSCRMSPMFHRHILCRLSPV